MRPEDVPTVLIVVSVQLVKLTINLVGNHMGYASSVRHSDR